VILDPWLKCRNLITLFLNDNAPTCLWNFMHHAPIAPVYQFFMDHTDTDDIILVDLLVTWSISHIHARGMSGHSLFSWIKHSLWITNHTSFMSVPTIKQNIFYSEKFLRATTGMRTDRSSSSTPTLLSSRYFKSPPKARIYGI
jgi:hypothetical protein